MLASWRLKLGWNIVRKEGWDSDRLKINMAKIALDWPFNQQLYIIDFGDITVTKLHIQVRISNPH